MLDIILVGVSFQFFKNDFQFENVLLGGLIIGLVQMLVFNSQFKFALTSKTRIVQFAYLFVPTIHFLVLSGLSYFLDYSQTINYFYILDNILINLLIGEALVGLFSIYKRYNLFQKMPPSTNNYIYTELDNYKERAKLKEENLNKEKEKVLDSMYGFKF